MQRLVISDPKTGKAYSLELDEAKARSFIGLEIGKSVDASPLGLQGYKLEITGGSDKDGFPMRSDLRGRVRQKVLLASPPGYHPKKRGLKRRKMVRGKVVTPEIVQINVKVVEQGEKPLDELIKPAEKKEKKETRAPPKKAASAQKGK